MKEDLTIVKLGGNILDDPVRLEKTLNGFDSIAYPKLMVHGGGVRATQLLERLDIEPRMVDGRRITDAETLEVVTMVYAGLINKNLVSQLQAMRMNALGITGADLNSILAHKRPAGEREYGFVGDIDSINVKALEGLIERDVVPVLAPITHDGKGQLLNTNADTIAAEMASSLSQSFRVRLIFCFEIDGVFEDFDRNKMYKSLTRKQYEEARKNNVFEGGIIPKLDNAFSAIDAGVHEVVICKYDQIGNIQEHTFVGTVLQ